MRTNCVFSQSVQGGLDITYSVGPSNYTAYLKTNNTFFVGTIPNVIAKIPGEFDSEYDRPVLLGNHRDAWVAGAVDPNSGAEQSSFLMLPFFFLPLSLLSLSLFTDCQKKKKAPSFILISILFHRPTGINNQPSNIAIGCQRLEAGTASLLEVAKGLGELLAKGWKPLRSIYLCSWSGEEFGLLGSTAFGELNADWLDSTAVAYINVDCGVSRVVASFKSRPSPPPP